MRVSCECDHSKDQDYPVRKETIDTALPFSPLAGVIAVADQFWLVLSPRPLVCSTDCAWHFPLLLNLTIDRIGLSEL